MVNLQDEGMHEHKLWLPFPPSTNNLFAGKSRRYPTNRYRMWRDMAYTQIGISKLPELTEDCVIDITLTPPHKPRRRRDVDNYSKALLDALVHMRVLKDDHIIQELTTRWDRNGDEPGASIKIFTKEKSHQEFYS